VKRRSRTRPQPSSATSPIRPADIPIILAEYQSRQNEKNAAAGGIGSVISVALALLGATLAWIIYADRTELWLIVPAIILLTISMDSDRQFSVLYHSSYISFLEERINRIAHRSLLQWETRGSSYHTYLQSSVIKNVRTGQRAKNLGPYIIGAYLLIPAGIFLFGLASASEWLLSHPLAILSPAATVALYLGLHLVVLIFLLFNRFVSRPRLLALLKQNLRDELFPELVNTSKERAKEATR
jgi:hypothetical protein